MSAMKILNTAHCWSTTVRILLDVPQIVNSASHIAVVYPLLVRGPKVDEHNS